MKDTILLAGGSGFIGKSLTTLLIKRGYKVNILTRKQPTSKVQNEKINYFTWSPSTQSIDKECFTNVICCINLSGAGIVDKRWTDSYKKELIESRTLSTKLLVNYLNNNNTSCKTLINASAIGYYGVDKIGISDENTPVGKEFLSHICKVWEDETSKLDTQKTRLAIVRIGIVLSTKSGALKEIMRPMELGFGSNLGSGKQVVSFIHINDLCEIFLHVLEHSNLSGVYNGVAPYPTTNEEMTKIIANAIHKPLLLPNVPKFLLKMILGESASIVTGSMECSADKIISTGYQFKYPKITDAIQDIIKYDK